MSPASTPASPPRTLIARRLGVAAELLLVISLALGVVPVSVSASPGVPRIECGSVVRRPEVLDISCQDRAADWSAATWIALGLGITCGLGAVVLRVRSPRRTC